MPSTLALGRSIQAHAHRWRAIQSRLGVEADAFLGDLTLSALEDALGITRQTAPRKAPDRPANPSSPFPAPDFACMVAHYGPPGDESGLVRVAFPYPMRLYTRDAPATLRSHRCHRLVADSLAAVLADILAAFGPDGIRRHGLDVFGGIYNDRKVRNGTATSKHAWGVAIDLNPGENRNRQKWRADKIGTPGWATMPLRAVEIFEAHGWKSGARAWGRDAMHFQATA